MPFRTFAGLIALVLVAGAGTVAVARGVIGPPSDWGVMIGLIPLLLALVVLRRSTWTK